MECQFFRGTFVTIAEPSNNENIIQLHRFKIQKKNQGF